MKRIMILCCCFSCSVFALAQQGVVIAGTTAHTSAMLDISRSPKGVLLPRMSQAARLGIPSPAEGLLVYDSSLHRQYQFQNGQWRYLINNTSWTKSASANHIYSFDSVGIGTSSPDARLEVIGNIRGRAGMTIADNLFAGNFLQGDDLNSSSNLVATGSANIAGNFTTQGNVTIENSGPLLQLKDAGVNKAFIQESDNNLRLGTNSGNTGGKMIIRMNGNDIISIDTMSSFKVLTNTGGNFNIGRKLMRFYTPADAPENVLPVIYGMVYGNNSGAYLSVNGTISLISTGLYEVEPHNGRPGARSSFLATPRGSSPVIANTYRGAGMKFYIELTDPITGNHVNADFNFVVMDPNNLGL